MQTASVHTTTQNPTLAQETLQMRARSKHITNAIVYKLAEIESPLKTQYWNAYHCSTEIEQEGDHIKSRYCNKRWCITCNRIRTAKLINGYGLQISQFKQPMFVTLSARNVPGENLSERINEYNAAFNRIRDNLRKYYKTPIIGVRKLEVTQNETTKEFHPHFHLIIDGSGTAQKLRDLWLEQWGEQADIKAQDIRPAEIGATDELFKYVVKLSAKGRDGIKGLDTIFQALKGRRLVASYGIKMISEDVDPDQKANIDWKPSGNYVYSWNSGQVDWMKGTGEPLSGYVLDEKTRATVEKILHGYIEITAPGELIEDLDQLKSLNWQKTAYVVDPDELDLINKMIARDNPVNYSVNYKKPPDPPKQLSLIL